ncbi:MAG: VWA domain-containing protein [Candidatus Omnitrophota bacterium]
MRFARGNFLEVFLIILVIVLFYFWVFKARKKAEEKFAAAGLLKGLLESFNPARQRLKASLIVLALFLSLIALMRPQWGFRWEEAKRKGLDIMIAVDTSKSMLAEDVLPSRLERTRLAIKDFLKNLSGDRIGLIAFSGSAFLQCPLTVDYSGFLLSLEDLNVESIPRGGTNIASAIKEAMRSFAAGENSHNLLVIISDGENLEGDAESAAKEAIKAGVSIYTIGVGTKQGELIPLGAEGSQKAFLKDASGNVVKSRLDEAALEKIALITGGSYVRYAPLEFGLGLLYRERFSQMEKKEILGIMNKRYTERFQWPLAAALILFLLEPLVSERK